MKAKHRRALEGLKSLLIVLLACSALFLASQTLFPMREQGLLSKLPVSAPLASEEPQTGLYSQLLRPAAFAVTREEGRYGQLYHQNSLEDYTQLYTTLAEAFTLAQSPVEISVSAWTNVLSHPGLYCEYLGAIPLDVFSLWLSGTENPTLSGHSSRYFYVTETALYFWEDSTPYSCPLTTDLTPTLSRLFTGFTPNGALFAHQDTRFSPLQNHDLVLLTTPIVPTLTGEIPISASPSSDTNDPTFVPNDALFDLLQQLSFHPQTNPLYAVGDGYAITDSSETLRISSSGQISYKRSDFSTIRYFCEENPLEYTKNLVESTLGNLAGNAHIYLQNVEKSGQTTTISYGFAFYGAKIDLEDTLWCATFTIEQDTITSFSLRPRRYTVLEGGDVALLPQEQAVAVLGGFSNDFPSNSSISSQNSVHLQQTRTLSEADPLSLGIYYYDLGTGEAIKPFWAVKEG